MMFLIDGEFEKKIERSAIDESILLPGGPIYLYGFKIKSITILNFTTSKNIKDFPSMIKIKKFEIEHNLNLKIFEWARINLLR